MLEKGAVYVLFLKTALKSAQISAPIFESDQLFQSLSDFVEPQSNEAVLHEAGRLRSVHMRIRSHFAGRDRTAS